MNMTVCSLQGELRTSTEASTTSVRRLSDTRVELKSVKERLHTSIAGHAATAKLLSAAPEEITACGIDRARVQIYVEQQHSAGKSLVDAVSGLRGQLFDARSQIQGLQAMSPQKAHLDQV